MKFWTLDGFDPNKILLQSVCYLLKEETDVACVHVKNPLQQPSQKDNVVDLENLCTYVGLPSSTLYKIADILNLDVISYDYSSYGISTGKLSEKHHYRSIQLLYNFMSNKLGIDDQRIIIWGKSLGTVSSVHISKIHKVHHQMSIVHRRKDDIWALKHVVKLSKRYPGSRLVKALSLAAFGYAVTISSLTKSSKYKINEIFIIVYVSYQLILTGVELHHNDFTRENIFQIPKISKKLLLLSVKVQEMVQN
ncbi:Alpha/beta hydrolase domain-containing protein 17C [Trichinella murrelli]|uniref:Alpha/beta hydrolase domain-containing protein 17C n=1 Tax=Trichinella murrelli TaxID=144512 RepID=A0A0V0UEW8_9BILA|nr:Alpha/beta hydrolase domain-containing protein 17C [Trichinella murrelli]